MNVQLFGTIKNLCGESPERALVNWRTLSNCDELVARVKQHLQNFVGDARLIGLKQPGMCDLLPLYLQAIDDLGYRLKIVVALRNPKEAVASRLKLMKHETFDQVMTCAANAYFSILKYTKGRDVLVVDYEDLLGDPRETVSRLRVFIPELSSYEQVEERLSEFLDRDLKHNNTW